jgi:hypothetical protein
MTTEALRALINAILVFPGERRGKVSVTLRGIERRFLRSDAVVLQLAPANKKAALLGENGVGWEVLGTLGCGDRQPPTVADCVPELTAQAIDFATMTNRRPKRRSLV